MKPKFKRIIAALLPTMALGASTASLDARADDAQDQIAGFVGKPVYDENGTWIGDIKELVVADVAHGNETVAFVAHSNGDITPVSLGETEALIATIAAAQVVTYTDMSPELTSPDYITPESRGS